MTLGELLVEYEKERSGNSYIWESEGFVAWKFEGNDIIFISDIYIRPGNRGDKLSHKLAKRVEAIGKESGRKIIACQAHRLDPKFDRSVSNILAYGFSEVSENEEFKTFIKEIE